MQGFLWGGRKVCDERMRKMRMIEILFLGSCDGWFIKNEAESRGKGFKLRKF
jgi:hypothetical protein